MCAEIINLRQARKQKKRDDNAQQAAQNRVRHGRTKAERNLEKQLKAQADRAFEQGHLEKPGKEPEA